LFDFESGLPNVPFPSFSVSGLISPGHSLQPGRTGAHPPAAARPPATDAAPASNPAARPAEARDDRDHGFYAALALGVGGPFGGTVIGSLAEAPGSTLAVGYAFHPNVGINAFTHYNLVRWHIGSDASELDENSGTGVGKACSKREIDIGGVLTLRTSARPTSPAATPLIFCFWE
jgi:hypothetical protein